MTEITKERRDWILPPGEWWMFYDEQIGRWCVFDDGPPQVVRTGAEVFHVREVRALDAAEAKMGAEPVASIRQAAELAERIWSDLDDVRRETNLTDAWASVAEAVGRDILSFAASLYAAPPAAEPVKVTDAARDVLAERQRQIAVEGWVPEHDDLHADGGMAVAAGLYALAAGADASSRRWIERGTYSNDYFEAAMKLWPWSRSWWKPTTRRRDLVKAAALILAEVERIDRAALTTSPEPSHE